MLRRTLNRPEIHHSLIEVCCLSGRQEFLGPCGEDPFPLGCSDGFGNPEIPGEHPIDIPVHHGGWQTEGDGADGRCGIISHALQGADTVQRIREAPGGGNLFGGGVQVPGPAVIAQALPKPQDFVFRSVGQVTDGREALHETLPVGLSLGDAGLL
jgi:hypothetical protein